MTLHTMSGLEVQPGDFGVVRMPGNVGTLIHLGEILDGDGFADFEHAVTYIGGAGDMILEAEPSGAKINPMHYGYTVVEWSTVNPALNLTRAQQLQVAAVCDPLKGTPYSALDYFALAAHRLGIPAPGLRSYIGSTGHQICSQMVDYVRLHLGFHLFTDGRWPGYVTPADLANVIG